ncbi:GH3 family domain-containing protein [Leptospira brenneri]|uniref:GH3 middle domain-containing protein n=1 Tax=Leptospira brenneri TaxID=2023182 RepID=A0A2M9XWU0_9LEPT|nr:GH3 auxin-responsive promoter family protein [Leptospira brenneri]PJZ43832.1 hypothetical protein CH361_18310 [Leptospira brenneri]TGK92407.1 hypothetical protein EHQ30_13200 [Leptospira brenneri]
MYHRIASQLWKFNCKNAFNDFLKNQNNVSSIQTQILKKILSLGEKSLIGKRYSMSPLWDIKNFQENIPISEYSDYKPYIESILNGEKSILTDSKIRRLGLSSGSSGALKYIPFTDQLSQEFSHSISVWIYGLFSSHPEIMDGQFYFSVSPSGFPESENGKISIGFDKDGDYLKPIERIFAKTLLIVPEWLSKIPDTDFVMYVTCLRLLATENLSFVSIWNPSYFLSILERILKDKDKLIWDLENGTISEYENTRWKSYLSSLKVKNFKRANKLKTYLYDSKPWLKVWPNLKRFSLWTDSFAEKPYLKLKTILPDVSFESKGVFATEGTITIPVYTNQVNPKHMLAYTSHFFEFMDSQGNVFLPSELVEGSEYEVLLTTGGGFYRYRIGDRFQMISKIGEIPELKFLGRNDDVSDLVGEKINESFLRREMEPLFAKFGFLENKAFLRGNLREEKAFYELVIHLEKPLIETQMLSEALESALLKNPHYAYARRLGQLDTVRISFEKTTKDKVGRVSTDKHKFLRRPT